MSDPSHNQTESPQSLRIPWFLTANAVIAAAAWLFFVSHGFTARELLDGVYFLQSRALEQFQLRIEPGPLHAFYDDVLLYRGKYYFYWGLLPSALLAVIRALFGSLAAHYLIVFGFFLGITYFVQRILIRMVRSVRPRDCSIGASTWLGVGVSTWLFVFVIPFPPSKEWFFQDFVIYEQQILFGLAFGLAAASVYIDGISKRQWGPIALGATLLALAACTRVTWVPLALAAVPLSAVYALHTMPQDAGIGSALRRLCAFVPAVGLIAVVLIVNDVRFESPFDFGVRHQNPGLYVYVRNLKMLFATEARVWNFFLNIISYFAPPVQWWFPTLYERSFSYLEGFPPAFFFFNPQFLPMIGLVPAAVYRVLRNRSAIASAVVVTAGIFAYLILILGVFSNAVILRYFVEFLPFMLLLFAGSLLVFLRPPIVMAVLVTAMLPYAPAAIGKFVTVEPNLRGAHLRESLEPGTLAYRKFFIRDSVTWPLGRLTAAELPHLDFYNTYGVKPLPNGIIAARDLFTIYVIPAGCRPGCTSVRLSLPGLRAASREGRLTLYLENRPLIAVPVDDSPKNVEIVVPDVYLRFAPYEIMGVFLEQGVSALPPRAAPRASVVFRELRLEATPEHQR